MTSTITEEQNDGLHEKYWYYVDTAVKGSELYCYYIEGNRNPVVSQASCRMDVSRIYKFIQEEEEVTR